ncbi:hypothetical protein J6590_023845 [Homalodisca vitripennis]|nr:hypothetical protein J6590_023845 [Homalodisca vitripennis]
MDNGNLTSASPIKMRLKKRKGGRWYWGRVDTSATAPWQCREETGIHTVGVTKECSWRRPIKRIGQRDVATQQVSNSPARRAAVTARNKFGNVAYSSLAAPKSRSK